MEFAGVLPHDAPDPRLTRAELLAQMPIPVVELIAQPHLETEDFGIGRTTDALGVRAMVASMGSIVWRKPDDRSDPVNFAELDDATREALDEVPPWPRPAWLLEQVERMRYPHLWEAVRTTWRRDDSEPISLAAQLVDHLRHIVMNQYRERAGIAAGDWDSPALADERSVRLGAPAHVDGIEVMGAEIDTDPFVYAIGAELPGGVFTAVLPREHLDLIDLRFATSSSSTTR
ncbi:hypothetical protein ACI7YT_10675 [Microbacterium sp. M]|uniref:hypothetical protein n=1 Tax=Microbacterium sp. M TaxID=3377125 RepID=UPI00386F98FB